MKLTQSQKKQLEILKDGKWHNIYNKGFKGLKLQTMEALVKKGLVEQKKDIDINRELKKFGKKFSFHSDRDIFFRIIKGVYYV